MKTETNFEEKALEIYIRNKNLETPPEFLETLREYLSIKGMKT